MGNSWIAEMVERWDREAASLEKQAEAKDQDYSEIERRMLRLHARVKRGAANELRIEARKVRRG